MSELLYGKDAYTEMNRDVDEQLIAALRAELEKLKTHATEAEKEASDYKKFWQNAIDEVQKRGDEIERLKEELRIMEMDRTMQKAAAEEMEEELRQTGDAIWNALTLLASRGAEGGIVYHTQLDAVTKAAEILTEVMTSE